MLRKSWIAGIIAVACAIGIVFANDGLLERLYFLLESIYEINTVPRQILCLRHLTQDS